MILLFTLVVILFGSCYALLAPKTYKAEVRLLPPPAASLSGLKKTIEVSPDEAFFLTNRMLDSIRVKKKLFSEYIEKKYPKVSDEDVFMEMAISFPNEKNNRGYTEVSFEWDDPEQAAIIVNKWVELALMLSREQLVKDAKSNISERIEHVKNKISAKENVAKAQIDSELLQLREAREIAEKNNIIDPIDVATRVVTNNESYANVMDLRSLYLLGRKALSAEIAVLERRKEQPESYVPGMAILKEELGRLVEISIEPDLVKTAMVDTWALTPNTWIMPDEIKIISASTVLGLLVGMMVAFFRIFIMRGSGKI